MNIFWALSERSQLCDFPGNPQEVLRGVLESDEMRPYGVDFTQSVTPSARQTYSPSIRWRRPHSHQITLYEFDFPCGCDE